MRVVLGPGDALIYYSTAEDSTPEHFALRLPPGEAAAVFSPRFIASLHCLRHRCEDLPEDGVPMEMLHLLRHDDHLDKVQVQKAATLVDGRCS